MPSLLLNLGTGNLIEVGNLNRFYSSFGLEELMRGFFLVLPVEEFFNDSVSEWLTKTIEAGNVSVRRGLGA